MPQLIPFSDEQITEMELMREAGASLRDIASFMGTSASTVLSYVRGIRSQPKGQDLIYTPLNVIQSWAQALPPQGLPISSWVVNWMQERSQAMQQLPTTYTSRRRRLR